jgi:hypothetical protein
VILASSLLAALFGLGGYPWREVIVAVLVLCILIGIARARSTEKQVVRHWSHLIDDFEYSPKEFYSALEQELKARDIPKASGEDLWVTQGGLLTGKRRYLRVKRGKHRMDICAAPFGRSFFFSWWLIEPPSWLRLSPIIGWLINFLWPETYFKIDTALMFQSAVHQAVQDVIDQVSTAKGVRALTEGERKPIMRGFFGR